MVETARQVWADGCRFLWRRWAKIRRTCDGSAFTHTATGWCRTRILDRGWIATFGRPDHEQEKETVGKRSVGEIHSHWKV